MMFYKNMKAMVWSPDDNTDFFKIITKVLHGDILAPYMFIICQDFITSLNKSRA